MQKNKIISSILILVIAFSTFFSFSVSYGAGDDETDIINADLKEEEIIERLEAQQTNNPFEMAVSGICLNIGDFILDYVTSLFSDEITIDRLVFNRIPSLDANFFEANKGGLIPNSTEFLCKIINDWYALFRGLAIVAYLIVLVMLGIKILLGVAREKSDAKDLLVKWTIGLAILVLFPYVMKYAFTLNDSIVTEIRKSFTNDPYDEIIGAYIGGISDVQYDQVFEERSPEYVSKSDYVYSLGTEEATFSYFRQLEKYKSRGDVMRIMRALAGVTGSFIYVILWYIMMGQMLILAFMYTKRYLMIAFLIIIFPITVIEYIIGLIKTGKGGGFSAWCAEFFLNVFIQSIHALIYGLIGGVVMQHIRAGLAAASVDGEIQKMNWLLLIIAVNFIFEGEKIAKKIINASAESIKDGSEVIKGVSPNKIKGKFKDFIPHF